MSIGPVGSDPVSVSGPGGGPPSTMVKLGCSFSGKPGKDPGDQDGSSMDSVPLISPLDVSQLQPPFPDQVSNLGKHEGLCPYCLETRSVSEAHITFSSSKAPWSKDQVGRKPQWTIGTANLLLSSFVSRPSFPI